MKWIPITKARQLRFNQPVFIQYTKPVEKEGDLGFIGFGKLVEEKINGSGTVKTFEVAQFFSVDTESPEFTTSVTHVAIP